MENVISEKKCLRCDHSWFPRTPDRPYVCPKCKNARWDITARPYNKQLGPISNIAELSSSPCTLVTNQVI